MKYNFVTTSPIVIMKILMLQRQWLLSLFGFIFVRLSYPLVVKPTTGFLRPGSSRQHVVSKFSTLARRLGPVALTTFDQMNELDARLGVLERSAPATLGGFYEPHLNSFSVQPGSVTKPSITSTCYTLQAILAAEDPALYDSLISMNLSVEKANGAKVHARNVVKELLSTEWRDDDMFQLPLLLSTLLLVDSSRTLLGPNRLDEATAARVRNLLANVLAARPQRRQGYRQEYSSYVQFQCAQVYAMLSNTAPVPNRPSRLDEVVVTGDSEEGIGGLPTSALPDGISSQLYLALSRCSESSLNELCHQLALRSAGDETSFDVMRLAYSLLTYVTATKTLAGSAGRELVPGQGPSPGSKVGPINRRLARAALAAFFEEQRKDGLWDKGQPIYNSDKSGRNVGNAFIFGADTLSSLMEKLPPEIFRPHLASLAKALTWIEGHQSVEVISDYCDLESGACYGKTIRGWVSPHLSPNTGPQAWSTAQVLSCVSRMRIVVRALMHKDVLNEFRGVSFSEEGIVSTAWDRLLDSDVGKCDTDLVCTLKQVIEQRIIEPRESSKEGASYGAKFSSILFGPPGTAKTTICESLAQRMGWDFVVIDTAVFLADGLTNVAARIRYVFERLQALRNCVILFDEIEEFCLDRETPGLGMESRMLTTAMLTAINDLRRAKRSIFFLATNRLRAFDAAIIRPGRFDMQLFVGPPNLQARSVMFRQQLAKLPLVDDAKEKAMATYQSFLASSWTKDAMFMNYLEGMQFAEACAGVLASGSELTVEVLSDILTTQAAVMTNRGAVRDEFLASMELSRL